MPKSEYNQISVIHTVGSLDPRAGGPSKTVPTLVSALQKQGSVSARLISQGLRSELINKSIRNELGANIPLTSSKLALKLGIPLIRTLRREVRRASPALLHDHGIWMPANHSAAAFARSQNIPLLIHPRGMLEPWALDFRSWKKRLALKFYQRYDLESAVLLFATAEKEAHSIRRIGLRQPIAIIPNGVDLPFMGSYDSMQRWRSCRKRNALFLSRIHPIKGLLNLVEAWGRVRPERWRLQIAGPDEGGHLDEVMQRVRELGVESMVEYLGEVEGETKTALFAHADLFILPSFSENFGVVVAEALAHGVPVITTHGTPWMGLEEHGCGWWVEPTVNALSVALRDAMKMDMANLRAMGKKGHLYSQEFNWSYIARQTTEVYRWVLGQGPVPACVVCD